MLSHHIILQLFIYLWLTNLNCYLTGLAVNSDIIIIIITDIYLTISFVSSNYKHCPWRSSRESDTPRHCWSWMYHTAHWDRVYLNIPDFVNQITCWSVIHIYFMWQLCHHHRPPSNYTQKEITDLSFYLSCSMVFEHCAAFVFGSDALVV